jgi:hypothetical protein
MRFGTKNQKFKKNSNFLVIFHNFEKNFPLFTMGKEHNITFFLYLKSQKVKPIEV